MNGCQERKKNRKYVHVVSRIAGKINPLTLLTKCMNTYLITFRRALQRNGIIALVAENIKEVASRIKESPGQEVIKIELLDVDLLDTPNPSN